MKLCLTNHPRASILQLSWLCCPILLNNIKFLLWSILWHFIIMHRVLILNFLNVWSPTMKLCLTNYPRASILQISWLCCPILLNNLKQKKNNFIKYVDKRLTASTLINNNSLLFKLSFLFCYSGRANSFDIEKDVGHIRVGHFLFHYFSTIKRNNNYLFSIHLDICININFTLMIWFNFFHFVVQ